MAPSTASGSATSSAIRSSATTSWPLSGRIPANSRPSCPPAPASKTLTRTPRKGGGRSPHTRYVPRETPLRFRVLPKVLLESLPVFSERIIEFYQLARVLTDGLDGFDPRAQALEEHLISGQSAQVLRQV